MAQITKEVRAVELEEVLLDSKPAPFPHHIDYIPL
jgi:hypothetical protein